MNTPNDYKQVYKNLGTTPRTLGDAYRNADYATPIWRCESDTEKALKFIADSGVGFLIVAIPVLALALFTIWLFGLA